MNALLIANDNQRYLPMHKAVALISFISLITIVGMYFLFTPHIANLYAAIGVAPAYIIPPVVLLITFGSFFSLLTIISLTSKNFQKYVNQIPTSGWKGFLIRLGLAGLTVLYLILQVFLPINSWSSYIK